MNMEDIKDKVFQNIISYISKRYKVSDDLYDVIADAVSGSLDNNLKALLTLISHERAEAVRGFVKYCKLGLDKAFLEKTYPNDEIKFLSKEIAEAVKVFMADEIDFYLQSLDKGDK